MAVIEQERALVPATYRVGDAMDSYDPSRLAENTSETQRALSLGLSIPIIDYHTAPDDPDGLPKESRRASEISVGWLVGQSQNEDGSINYKLDVTNDQALQRLKEGSVKFTSPQISRRYVDGLGREFKNLTTHIALTNKPRNPNQGRFKFDGNSAQFALDDIVDEENTKPEVAEETKPEETPAEAPKQNPDIVKPAVDPDVEAVIANLATLGAMLRADWNPNEPGAMGELNSVLKTLATATQKAEADSEADKIGSNDTEEVQPVQFSQEEIAALPIAMRAKAIKANEATKAARAAAVQFALTEAGHKRDEAVDAVNALPALPKGLKDKLTARLGTVQFSADGEPATLTVVEAATLFNESIPAQFALAIEAAKEVEDPTPRGDGKLTEDEADELARRVHARNKK